MLRANFPQGKAIYIQKRQTLVSCVIDSGESLTKVAKRLKIKLSTGKIILKKYRSTGILFNKKLRNAKKEPKKTEGDIKSHSHPIAPKANKQNHNSTNEEQTRCTFPEVKQGQAQANVFLNPFIQTPQSWQWFYIINWWNYQEQ